MTGMPGMTGGREYDGSIRMHVDNSDSEGEGIGDEKPYLNEDLFKPYNEKLKE